MGSNHPGTGGRAMGGRTELKFPFPAHYASWVCAQIRMGARPRPEYPTGNIYTVYMDTPQLDCFHDAIAGDFHKFKVRLRWYDEQVPGKPLTVFVENKEKRGFLGLKHRLQREIVPNTKHPISVSQIIRAAGIGEAFRQWGLDPGRFLTPVILIQFKRSRFIDVANGIAHNVDTELRSRLLRSDLGTVGSSCACQEGVLEIKGPSADLPRVLKAGSNGQFRRSNFSKYVRCLEDHLP